MNLRERKEYTLLFEGTMCTICRSKYCKRRIHVKRKNGVTSIKCDEYNKTRKDQLKWEVKLTKNK